MIQCSSGTFCDLHITSTFGRKASSVARYIFVHNFVPKIVTYFGLKIVQFWTLFCQTENRDIFWHIFRYKNVPKYNPLLPRIFGWIFSGFSSIFVKDIVVGKPINLLLPSGIVVTTSPVQEWRKYGSFSITTKNSQYFIAYEG